MEEILKALNTKLELLQVKASKSTAIAEKGIIETTQRHCDNLRTLSKEVNELKLRVEQEKVSKGEQVSDITVWSEEIDTKLEEVDRHIFKLGECVDKATKQAHLQADEKALEIQREKQLAFERAQLELKFEFDKKAEELKNLKSKSEYLSSAKTPTAKLPKLSITKYDGTYEQWYPFWNKFEAEIDHVDLTPVTKFAYLKELLVPKVRANIDGLPFTTEGYERAKNILKSEYGKLSEVVNAYVNNIMELPTITSSCPKKVDEFYRVLRYNVQSLDTLGKLKEISGNTRAVLDKLKGIKADLVRGDSTWQDWDFSKLLTALKTWKEINVIEDGVNSKGDMGYRKGSSTRVGAYQAQQKIRTCVYCDSKDHRSSDCTKHVTVDVRKKILASKHLCFNCTGTKHRAAECKSRSCTCGQRHHTSICNHQKPGETLMTAQPGGYSKVIYPVVVVDVQGVRCRALLDTGAGSSYASAALLDLVKAHPTKSQIRTIEMMLGAQTKKVELFSINVDSVSEDFSLKVEVTRVEKPKLLEIDNPCYTEVIQRYPHLKHVTMKDNDAKPKLPVHLILGASEYARIKKDRAPCLGHPGDPVAELTSFGWTVMSPGEEADVSKVLLTQTSSTDYEALCKMDILGLEDPQSNDQETVFSEFKEQLQQSPEGWYETGLPWKGDKPFLPNNKTGSLRRLDNLVRRLDKSGMIVRYHNVIQSQLEEGIVERVTDPPVGTEFYIPHKAVVRESAESTKLRVVYDASAQAHDQAPSLNDCLHPGPPLQNLLWAVLVRNRFHPVIIQGDIKQAFLQVRIRETERDALRFHWLSDLDSRRVEVLRFTRALFGLAPSPFLLAGVLQQHLDSFRSQYPEIVEEIQRSLYVDDLIGGGPTVEAAREIKSKSTSILSKAAFTLHKWHSNMEELEAPNNIAVVDSESYAKQQLGIPRQGEGAILGLPWTKGTDEVKVKVRDEEVVNTKRGILKKIAKVYDPLGVVSPTTLGGKLIYREVCDKKIPWDQPLPEPVMKIWSRWEQSLPNEVSIPRSIPKYREPVTEITIHGFGDASGKGVSAVVYAVVVQESGISAGLVTAKARLAKRGLSIPRLELVSAHMTVNLTMNVADALQGFPVGELHCWLDSTVALYWIHGAGEYKQFVHNRVQKINVHNKVKWHHVSSGENPADLGSRSGNVKESKLWWQGPAWLTDRDSWPANIVPAATAESQVEAKVVRKIFATAMIKQASPDELDNLLNKFSLWKVLRVGAWTYRFIHNAKVPQTRRVHGPLTTDELCQIRLFWEKRAQQSAEGKQQFQEDRLQLNLQKNSNGVFECRGRIQGSYPTYIPEDHPYARKLVEDAHLQTLHGGVSLTMAKVREFNWIPRLRRLAKKTLKECNRCRRYRAKALESPPPGNLPKDRSEGKAAFKVVGVDYAGPFKYKKKKNVEGKAYLLLYACSLTRALYLELLPNLETSEFLSSFKRFIARRGRPSKIYSDNGKTFVGAANWLKKVMKDESFNDFLARHKIKWQFNLSRAPWWGGQFERLVGLVKRSLSKCIGNGNLTFTEFQDVVLDVEVALNNRPLCYIEDDIQFPVLRPSTFLHDQPNNLPELETHHEENKDLRKRSKYLKRCKDVVWQRWTSEYLRALRERHRLKHSGKEVCPQVGEVVLIKSEQKDRGKWKTGIVQKLFPGRDGVVRAVDLKVGGSQLQRPIQHLYPLELFCDIPESRPESQLNADAQVFTPRVTRAASREARNRITALADDESD